MSIGQTIIIIIIININITKIITIKVGTSSNICSTRSICRNFYTTSRTNNNIR